MQKLHFHDYIPSIGFSEREGASERRKAEDSALPCRALLLGRAAGMSAWDKNSPGMRSKKILKGDAS